MQQIRRRRSGRGGVRRTDTIFAGPATGAAAPPTFRALSAADMPIGFGGVVTEVQNTAGDGSGDVTFTNAAANVFIAVLTGSDTMANINLPMPTATVPFLCNILIDGTLVGVAPSGFVNVSIGFPIFGTGSDSVVMAPAYWTGSSWTEVGVSTMDANMTCRNLVFTDNGTIMGLPTSDPKFPGALWNSLGSVIVSAG